MRGVAFERQKPLPISYKNTLLESGYRLDFVLENKLIVELKSVDALTDVHEAQLLTYMKLSGCKLGLLINFNVLLLKNGICRLVLNY